MMSPTYSIILALVFQVLAIQLEWTSASKVRFTEEYLPFWSYPSNEKIGAVQWIEKSLSRNAKGAEETQAHLIKLVAGGAQAAKDCDERLLDSLQVALADLVEVSFLESDDFCSSHGVGSFLAHAMASRAATGQKVSIFNPKLSLGKSELFDYLMTYGPRKSQKCLGRLNDLFDDKILNNHKVLECESKLDQVVSLGKAAGQQEEKLLQMASEVDFLNGQFDGKKMQSVVEKVYEQKPTDALETLFRFLDDTCHQFRSQVSDIFDTYNLARIILPSAMRFTNFGTKFHKFNEYSRLCSQFQAPHLRDATKTRFAAGKKWY